MRVRFQPLLGARLALLVTALSALSACMSKLPEGRLSCKGASDCPVGWFCHEDKRCYSQAMLSNTAVDSGTSSAERDAMVPTASTEVQDASMRALDSGSTVMEPMAAGERGGSGGAAGSGGAGGSMMSAVDAGHLMMSMPQGGSAAPLVQKILLGDNGCSATNTQCERSAECVDDRCLITTCESAGTFCDGPAECCDLACNGGLCKCGNHAAACSASTTPCCSGLYCETGQCATCKAQGTSCAGAYQCCGTTDCYSGICQCRPSGALCDSQSVCCAGTRCDGGTCKCRVEGEACDANTVCCSGSRCTSGVCKAIDPGSPPTSPVIWGPIKTTPILIKCLSNGIGTTCASSSDCCSQNCFDSKCVEACRKVGEAAEVDSQCCSRLQAEGKCAYAGCTKVGQTCTANQNCCSGSCVNAHCAAPM